MCFFATGHRRQSQARLEKAKWGPCRERRYALAAMREAPVAIEKKAVERAIRPPCPEGRGSRVNSSPGSNASASQTPTSALIARSSGSGVWGALGVSKLVSIRFGGD